MQAVNEGSWEAIRGLWASTLEFVLTGVDLLEVNRLDSLRREQPPRCAGS